MLDRHHNADFDSSSPVKFPNFLNDRYFGQDIQRNFWYQLGQSGLAIKGLFGSNGLLFRDGAVEKGTNFDDVNIPESIGYVEFDITVQDEAQAWQVPALTKTETLQSVRVRTPAVLDFDISGATLDGGTTNYLKMAYSETDGRTRTKTHAAGSYAFERIRGVTITADSTPATSKEILLATFIGDGSSSLTVTQVPVLLQLPIDQVFTITTASDDTVDLPDANGETAKRTYKRRGSGSGEVLFTTVNSQTINNESASLWKLTREGEITIFPNNGNWEVEDFRDLFEGETALREQRHISKAWINFNTITTTTITDDYNVSSLTDNGTGDTTINFANALPNANYSVGGTCTSTGSGGGATLNIVTQSTTQLRIETIFTTAVTKTDQSIVSAHIFGS